MDTPSTQTAMPMTPCHVVAGPLGVGKTSAILDYLGQQPPDQRVGVLVNDFGPIGIDSARLGAEAPSMEVINLQGGCICCTLLENLPETICRLTSKQKLDRIIIEPSGMASPAQAIDALRAAELKTKLSLQPTIVLLSAADFDEQLFERMPYYRMLYEVADVLVFNRCDQISATKVQRIRQWAGELDPPKLRVVLTSQGRLPQDLFGLPTQSPSIDQPTQKDLHIHQFDASAKPGGVILKAGRRFDEKVLLTNLARLCDQGVGANRVLRLKGVFHTDKGWQSIDIANDACSRRPSAYRRDNRMEWLTRPGVVEPEQMLVEIERPLQPNELTSHRPIA